MSQKWECNKCGVITLDKPKNKNSTCLVCHKGRMRCLKLCSCGNWFYPNNLQQKYCSKDCAYKNRVTNNKKGKHYPYLQRARIAVCPVCGKKFRAIHEYKDRKSIYCSKDCWNIRSRKINKCKNCGKEIITTKSQNKIFCCKECQCDYYSKSMQNENSRFWKGGKTKESKLLKTSKKYKKWRDKIFKRDNYTCQKCGSKRNLEAHHIKEQCLYPELIFEISNGITLCHNCHKLTDNYGYKSRWRKNTKID